MSGIHSEKDFQTLKEAGSDILRTRLREHTVLADRAKSAVVYIYLTPGRDDAPAAEVIVETALSDASTAEAVFHMKQAKLFERAIVALSDTTYEQKA